MAIFFTCGQCGHHVRAEDAHAGRRARCAHCGHKMMVPGARIHRHEHAEEDGPEPEFRLAPADEDPAPPSRLTTAVETPEVSLQPVDPAANGGPAPRLDPAADGPRIGEAQPNIPEELLADRAPIPLDPNYVPPPTLPGHEEPSWALMAVKARMYHAVRSILQKIEWLENWLYVVSLVFLMVAIAGLLLEYRPLAHFGAVWVTLSSILLAALGGIEVVIKPFQYGIFGTKWSTMKKQIRHALGAFIPLAVLIASYFFIKPIRDYFLDTAEARQLKQMSSISTPRRDRDDRRVVDHRRITHRTRI